jgi:hypothetical protein
MSTKITDEALAVELYTRAMPMKEEAERMLKIVELLDPDLLLDNGVQEETCTPTKKKKVIPRVNKNSPYPVSNMSIKSRQSREDSMTLKNYLDTNLRGQIFQASDIAKPTNMKPMAIGSRLRYISLDKAFGLKRIDRTNKWKLRRKG